MTLWNKPEARRVPEQNVAQQGRQPTRRHQRAGMGEPKGRMTQTPGADRQARSPKAPLSLRRKSDGTVQDIRMPADRAHSRCRNGPCLAALGIAGPMPL